MYCENTFFQLMLITKRFPIIGKINAKYRHTQSLMRSLIRIQLKKQTNN